MEKFAISASILILTVMIARTPLRIPVRMAARPLIWLSAMTQLRIEATMTTLTSPFRRKTHSMETDTQ